MKDTKDDGLTSNILVENVIVAIIKVFSNSFL